MSYFLSHESRKLHCSDHLILLLTGHKSLMIEGKPWAVTSWWRQRRSEWVLESEYVGVYNLQGNPSLKTIYKALETKYVKISKIFHFLAPLGTQGVTIFVCVFVSLIQFCLELSIIFWLNYYYLGHMGIGKNIYLRPESMGGGILPRPPRLAANLGTGYRLENWKILWMNISTLRT